ncbi:phosphoribosylformylglycinamidine synthase [Salmonella enterica subsp. diarizonae]|nr:phosphoribosylformylglycinamidine synthase [Salmonella enterica subsp. diarizonae]
MKAGRNPFCLTIAFVTSLKPSSIVRKRWRLGVCNGCQMMSNLRELIPGSELWPRFVRNHSDRFEARFSLVEVTQSPSLLLQGMVGSQMPIAVSHGGRAR